MKKLLVMLGLLFSFPAFAVSIYTFSTNSTGTATSTLTSNVTTNPVKYPFASGHAVVFAEGTWNGAAITFNFFKATSGGCGGFANAQAIPSVSLSSAAPSAGIYIGSDVCIQAVVASAGASTSLTVNMVEVP